MNRDEHQREFLKFVEYHDLDEEEYYALESWVNEGNSPYTNPDHYRGRAGDEVSYMRWYWILADPLHPEHRDLMNHRHRLEEGAANICGKPRLLKAKAEEILSMDYSDVTLNNGQDWYIGGSTFLSLEETKEHLLREMKYIKDAFRKLLEMEKAVDYELSKLDLTGNLFEDVLNTGELLDSAQTCAEEFLAAQKALSPYEKGYREMCFLKNGDEDLPF